MRRRPAHVYYARWTDWYARMIDERGWWTDEIRPIDERWWAWRHRNRFSEALNPKGKK